MLRLAKRYLRLFHSTTNTLTLDISCSLAYVHNARQTFAEMVRKVRAKERQKMQWLCFYADLESASTHGIIGANDAASLN